MNYIPCEMTHSQLLYDTIKQTNLLSHKNWSSITFYCINLSCDLSVYLQRYALLNYVINDNQRRNNPFLLLWLTWLFFNSSLSFSSLSVGGIVRVRLSFCLWCVVFIINCVLSWKPSSFVSFISRERIAHGEGPK